MDYLVNVGMPLNSFLLADKKPVKENLKLKDYACLHRPG